MKRILVSFGMLAAVASAAQAQRTFTYEAGLFAQYTSFADTTHLKSNPGGGARAGIFLLPKVELEYEASVIPTSSATQSGLNAWNNRIDAIFNLPLGGKTVLLLGGGFTGTNYKGDTTHNAYDSGVNALVGIRQCMSDRWSWRLDGVADFKNPSDQTRGAATQTYSGRLGVSWFIGGPSKNSPCSPAMAAPSAPAPPSAPTAPAPEREAPAPAPAAPPTPAAAPSPAPPAPAPARARELFTLRGVLFEFDKSTLTKGAKDTLGVAVRYLKEHLDARVEVQGNTDSKGTAEYNLKLGERRAESVKTYLISQGISGDRISTVSFGETKPVAENEINGKDNPAGRALNRRVVIIELP